MKTRLIALICLMALLLSALPAAALAEAAEPIEAGIREINKYGSLVLTISATGLLERGYEYGDIAAVTIDGQTWDMPVVSNYTDVDNGEMLIRVTPSDNPDENVVLLAINMADFATALGIATKSAIEEDPGFRWDYNEGYDDTLTVAIAMGEKGGYADEYMIHQLVRSEAREDYPDLTDEQYANFRNVATTGMGAYALYRSSSPVNPLINRNREADAAVNAAGICTIMNMADSDETMKGYPDYAETYYSALDVIALNLGMDFADDDFRAGLAEGFRFLAGHEGPFLIHCNEGKDRTGFAVAVLECLMGASAEEVVSDYMVTFANFYGVQPGTEKYDAIVNSNIASSLAAAFGVESIYDADLAAEADDYLLEIGMAREEIDALKANLGTDIQ